MTNIEYEHDDAKFSSGSDEQEGCLDEIEIELDYEPGESNYGADADGNRGISVPGYFYDVTDFSKVTKCEQCGRVYSADDHAEMEKLAAKAADAYEVNYEPDYPEPDYWDDR